MHIARSEFAVEGVILYGTTRPILLIFYALYFECTVFNTGSGCGRNMIRYLLNE